MYDVTIGYVDGVPTLWQLIVGSVRRIHVHVRRFPTEELPRLESELRDWVLERYREKDRSPRTSTIRSSLVRLTNGPVSFS